MTIRDGDCYVRIDGFNHIKAIIVMKTSMQETGNCLHECIVTFVDDKITSGLIYEDTAKGTWQKWWGEAL